MGGSEGAVEEKAERVERGPGEFFREDRKVKSLINQTETLVGWLFIQCVTAEYLDILSNSVPLCLALIVQV